MPFTEFLPGSDPSRASVNTLQFLQKIGVPTGALPDGSPNLGLVSELARQTGQELSEASSGFVQVAIPPDLILPSGRPSQGMMSGKKF